MWYRNVSTVINCYVLYDFTVRVNTFGKKVKIGTVDGIDQYHAQHEYTDTLKNIYAQDFKDSVEYEDFCRDTGRDGISYSKFKEGVRLCPCISEPTMRVCVDELETGFTELTECLSSILRRSARTPCECGFCESEARKKEELKKGEKAAVLFLNCEKPISYCVIMSLL